MSDWSTYLRQHRLGLRYGAGLVLMLAVPLGLAVTGDPPELRWLKTIASIPAIIALLALPSNFGEPSSRPFTPGFVERGALIGIVLACWLAMLSWLPTFDPSRPLISALLGFATYFGLHMLFGLFARRTPRP